MYQDVKDFKYIWNIMEKDKKILFRKNIVFEKF